MRGILPRNMGLYVPGTGFVYPQTSQFVNGMLVPTPAIMCPTVIPREIAHSYPQVTVARKQRSRILLQRGFKVHGCKCGGSCKKRGMGEPSDVCGPQPDGSIVPCPPDPAGATEQGDVPLPPSATSPAPTFPGGGGGGTLPSSNSSGVSTLLNNIFKDAGTLLQSTKGIPSTAGSSGVRSNAAATSSSFFSQSYAGIPVWGWGLGIIGGLALFGRSGK